VHLKRLEIVGFKSFADVFEMEFLPGISGIVGPNGCGKSNVADAIRWVLGSQSPIQLRVDRMEDVIFAGSGKRNPLGMSEVILTFDNEDRDLPLEFDEVSITRRLFRSGESEYLINGTKCRLMDITDLIVDKGLGHNGYWMLESRMIKTIIESKPQDRRFLFDEAAGIVRYKIQRHRAELKLDSVSHDLERLDDIISEVDSNVKVLRGQVRVFRRYEKAESRISQLSGLRTHRLHEELSGRLNELREREKTAKAEEQKALASASAAEAKHANAEVELDKAQQILDSAHTTCSQLDTRLSGIREDIAVKAVHLRNAENTAGEYLRQSEEEKAKSEKYRTSLLTQKEQIEIHLENMSASKLKYAEIKKRVNALDIEYKTASDSADTARQNYREIVQKYNSLESEFTDSLREIERARQELQNAGETIATIENKTVEVKEELKTASERLTHYTERKKENSLLLTASEKALENISSKLETDNLLIRKCELERSILDAKIDDLKKADSSSRANEISSGIKPKDGMGKAVGAWLDAFQSASVEDITAFMDMAGGKRFLAAGRKVKQAGLPEGAVPLADCFESDYPAELFSRVIVAPDRKTALEWFLIGLEFDIVTPDGDLFSSTGLVRLGVPPEGTGTLDRKVLVDEAAERKVTIEEESDAISDRLKKLKAESGTCSDEIEQIKSEIRKFEIEETSIRVLRDESEKRLEELETRLESLRKVIPALQSAAGGESPEAPDSLSSLRSRMGELSSLVEETEGKRTAIGESRNELLRLESESALEVSSLRSEIRQTEETTERLKRDAELADELGVEFREKSHKSDEDALNIKGELRELNKDREAVSFQREKAEEVRVKASSERGLWLQKTREYNSEVSQARTRLSSIREELAGISGEAVTSKQKLSELEEEEIVLPEESSKYWDYDDEKLLSELEKQRGYREDIGPVNMLAVTEYEEIQKRLTFLEEQRTDLEDARNSLLEAIGEINATAEKKFSEVFVQIKENFQTMFKKLFSGGEADVIALRSEDPLEGGIQIIAQPPGKKMENVTSLSDGEKAMTAVALLFALYLVKPSPFCVLDELDAPLDDSNVDNFVNLIRGFVDKTQFIIITHNKRTMEAADRLFGITMAERGVSTMTSVSLELAAEIAGSDTDESQEQTP